MEPSTPFLINRLMGPCFSSLRSLEDEMFCISLSVFSYELIMTPLQNKYHMVMFIFCWSQAYLILTFVVCSVHHEREYFALKTHYCFTCP